MRSRLFLSLLIKYQELRGLSSTLSYYSRATEYSIKKPFAKTMQAELGDLIKCHHLTNCLLWVDTVNAFEDRAFNFVFGKFT
jgi:hypothetical protein